MKKKKVCDALNVLAIDESWRGFGVAWKIETLKIEGVLCVDIAEKYCNNKKKFDSPEWTLQTLHAWLNDFQSEHSEWIDQLDVIVIESQFHAKMKLLQYMLMGILRSRFPLTQIFTVSALKIKRYFKIGLEKNHNANKKKAIKFVEERVETLFLASLVDGNDNLADAVLLLNFFMQQSSQLHNAMMETCMLCNAPKIFRKTFSGKNAGRYCIKCPGNCIGQGTYRYLSDPSEIQHYIQRFGEPQPKQQQFSQQPQTSYQQQPQTMYQQPKQQYHPVPHVHPDSPTPNTETLERILAEVTAMRKILIHRFVQNQNKEDPPMPNILKKRTRPHELIENDPPPKSRKLKIYDPSDDNDENASDEFANESQVY